jgi:hemerythrin-like domain-containing protein
MLVSLRRRASPPLESERDALLQLLLACHTRIRAFARLAEEMGRRRDLPAHEVADACRRCARYFEEALPLHVVDEEQSLVPRLIHKDRALDACLEAMQAQHVQHTAGTHALIAALHATERAPDDELARRALKRVAQSQVLAFDEHLGLEEREIFPSIEEHLTAAEQRAVIAELRYRRQLADEG